MSDDDRTVYETHTWSPRTDDDEDECILCDVTWTECDHVCPGLATGGLVSGFPQLEHPAPFVFTREMVESAFRVVTSRHIVWTHPGRGRVCACPLAGDHNPSAWRSPQALAEVGLTVGPGRLTPYTLCQSCGALEHAIGRCPDVDDDGPDCGA